MSKLLICFVLLCALGAEVAAINVNVATKLRSRRVSVEDFRLPSVAASVDILTKLGAGKVQECDPAGYEAAIPNNPSGLKVIEKKMSQLVGKAGAQKDGKLTKNGAALLAFLRYTGTEYSIYNAALRGPVGFSFDNPAGKGNYHDKNGRGKITPEKVVDVVRCGVAGLNMIPAGNHVLLHRTGTLPDFLVARYEASLQDISGGTLVHDPGFMSTSFHAKYSAGSEVVGGNPSKHLFRITPLGEGKSRCRDIAVYSAHPEEGEVLCLPGTQFHVTKKDVCSKTNDCSKTGTKFNDALRYYLNEVALREA